MYVYILRSIQYSEEKYTGVTKDLRARLVKHNKGNCTHTSKFAPWKIETAIWFSDPKKALIFERYLKSGSGRAFSKKHF